jgi:TonB family protein
MVLKGLIPRIAITALLTFAVSGQAQVAPAFPRDPVESLKHFIAAKSFFEKQNFQSAANELRAALQDNSLTPTIAAWAHSDLGAIFDLTGQSARALNEYKLVLLVKSDEASLVRSIATQRLSEGLTPSEATLHHLFGPYLPNGGVVRPVIRIPAEYSKEARIAQLEGTVEFFATIAPDGSVQDLRLSQPLGLGLDESAVAAAKHWSFEPAQPGDVDPVSSVPIELDFIFPAKTSRWHLVGVSFSPASGASPPHFLAAPYPPGFGVSNVGLDEAAFVNVEKRLAMVTLSFDIDQQGRPVNFRTQQTTYPTWGPEAIALVSKWRFTPGTKNATPVITPCTVNLIWGEKQFTHSSIVSTGQTAATMMEGNALRAK